MKNQSTNFTGQYLFVELSGGGKTVCYCTSEAINPKSIDELKPVSENEEAHIRTLIKRKTLRSGEGIKIEGTRPSTTFARIMITS